MIRQLKFTYKSAAIINWLAIVLLYEFSIFCFTSFGDRTYLQHQETDRYLTKPMLKTNTVEPPVSDHLNCDDLVVAYGWSLMRINPEKRSRYTYFLDENLLHAIS